MGIRKRKRNAELGILLTWCCYIAYAFLTDWDDFGLNAKPEFQLRWTVIRLSTFSIWLLLAAILLRYRKDLVNWRSFTYASIATILIALLVSSQLVPRSVSDVIIAGTIVFYALVSGLLCITVKKPKLAAVLGLLIFVIQFFIDAAAHIFSGIWRFH